MIYHLSAAFELKEEPYDPELAKDLSFSGSRQKRIPIFDKRGLDCFSISHLKALPSQDRPRERLAHRGSAALSTIELLAILLGSGTKNCSVLQLAAQLMARFGSLQDLSQASVQELSSLKGIGFAKAVQLKAAFSLVSRLSMMSTEKVCFDEPEKLFHLIGPELKDEKVEVLMVILFDVKRRLIHREIAARGILNEILVHPREIFHFSRS